jgi:hypothetical protein
MRKIFRFIHSKRFSKHFSFTIRVNHTTSQKTSYRFHFRDGNSFFRIFDLFIGYYIYILIEKNIG